METMVALLGTAFSALLLIVAAMNAGPLWRDEVNTINVAKMASMPELWHNMSFESFPPLWPLLLRGWDFLGLANSDADIRILGLFTGFFFLASVWFCSRCIGARAPMITIALMGSLPAFIFIVGANRAYGLGSALLVLSFGMIWRMIERPTRSWVLLTGLICFLFAHCVYYDVVFLCAMLAGGAMVVIRRRQWKTLLTLVVIGAVSASSLAIYLPVIHRGSDYVPMNQLQYMDYSTLWYALGHTLWARSNARFGGMGVWLWIVLIIGGSVLGLVMQRARVRQGSALVTIPVQSRADLALFCTVSLLLGTEGYMAFLLKLQYPTQTWYYVEMFCLCAVALDGLMGASWPALRPWGMFRIGFMVVIMTWYAKSAWVEAHTRRTNVDLIAVAFNQRAIAGDLVVVQSPWVGITFNRYYHGPAEWLTVPPIDSHKVHRNDLVFEKMNQPDPMAPVLREVTNTLQRGHCVWLVGDLLNIRPNPPPSDRAVKFIGPYSLYWSAQVSVILLDHAMRKQNLELPTGGPVSRFENQTVTQFSGYKPDAE